ncbi:acid protease [Trichodelitschia bisporula]|uniref:Acid protease n=1 Tax=Trichodelitschia bisporula TaxID=703511 RepID=A0A6G1HPZ5_9PEZI|nr:acid protease [Trichodelitschia bisporula]
MLLILGTALVALAAATPVQRRAEAIPFAGQRIAMPALEAAGYTAYLEAPEPWADPVPDNEIAAHSVDLTPTSGSTPSQKIMSLLAGFDGSAGFGGFDGGDDGVVTSGNSPVQNIGNTVYLTPIKVGAQDFHAVLDTGSADTWLVGNGFKCVSGRTNAAVSAKNCKFAGEYKRTAGFQEVKGQRFSTKYADGETLQGIIGRETVVLAGITAENQTIGVVSEANWRGDGKSSGLIGMAYPSITRAIQGGSGPIGTSIPYNPIYFSMHTKGLIKPVFSLTLNRHNEGPGALALGGLPPQTKDVKYETDNWAKSPLLAMAIRGISTKPVFTVYVVNAEGFTVDGAGVGGSVKVLVDSGTTLSYLPQAVADAVGAKFSPPSRKAANLHLVNCNAKAPKFGVKIGGKSLWIQPRDMIIEQASGAPGGSGGVCMMGIQGAGGAAGGQFILGGGFMRSVLSVFDTGASEMRFANRIRA